MPAVTAGDGTLFPEDVVDLVAAVAGVELAIPVVSGTAFMGDESGELLTVHGRDLTNPIAVSVYELSNTSGDELDAPKIFLPDAVVGRRSLSVRLGSSLGAGESAARQASAGAAGWRVPLPAMPTVARSDLPC